MTSEFTYSGSDLKDRIRQLENGFSELRTVARKRYYQLHASKVYEDELVAMLDEQVTTRIPYASRTPSVDAWAVQGILRDSLSFHVEPRSQTADERERADKIELFYAHLFGIIFNEGGKLLELTRRHQTVSPFAAWWLEYEDFTLPKDESKRQEYRETYQPFSLSVVDPLTVSFLPDDSGSATPPVVGRHYELPYIEVANRYGKKEKDKDNALTILRTQFPDLRGGRGKEVNYGDLWTRKATVWVLDDGDLICHSIEIKDGRDKEYKPLGEWPNPFGKPSLTIIPGRYNPEGEFIYQQYEPLLVDELNAQRKVDVIQSHIASLALTPAKHAQQIPPEVMNRLLDNKETIPGVEFGESIATVVGTMAELTTGLDIGSAKEVLALALADRDVARPSPYLTSPEENTLRNATAAAQLNAYETGNKAYDAPREALIAGITDVLSKVRHYVTHGMNKPGISETAREQLYVTPTGSEPVGKFVGDKKGKGITVGPDDFKDSDVLEITTAAESNSQKALQYELTNAMRAAGYKTWDDVVETFTEDVSGQKEKVNEEQEYQFFVPQVMRMTFLAFVEELRLKEGIDLSFLASQSGIFPGVPGEAPVTGEPSGDGASVGGSRTDPPAMGVPNVRVSA